MSTERPNATQKRDKNKHYEQIEKHHGDEKHNGDEKHDATNETAPVLQESPRSSHSQLPTTPNSTKSVIGSGSKTLGSSNSSEYDLYPVHANTLRVYRGSARAPEDAVEILQASPEYLEMHACVSAAMRILCQTRTRDAMAIYSVGIIDFVEEKYKTSTAGELKTYDGEMPDAISKWLKKLSLEFPNLYISPSLGQCYGETLRSVWGHHIKDYRPTKAACISINSETVGRMCALKKHWQEAEYSLSRTDGWKAKLEALEEAVRQAQNSEDTEKMAATERELNAFRREYEETGELTKNYEIHYERSLFQLAATLAHELFHVLTGYWSGFTLEITPPKYSGVYRDEFEGEAGEWWANKHGFSGIVHLAWNKSDKNKDDPYPLDDETMSAGVPFLLQTRYATDGSPDGVAWTRISHDFIKEYIKKGKHRNMADLAFRN